MTPIAPADDPSYRELRIAPVMTGGTSLAVWMGGVDTELYSLIRSLDDDLSGTAIEYERLLRLTRTRPVIDVVTGTSAGGLGGLLLAAAVCLGVPRKQFDVELRDTVMATADVTKLLRSSDEENPPSLLDGRIMEARLADLLDGWLAAPAPTLNPIDLVTTFTRVRPVGRGRVDDFGEALGEEVYAGTLHFTERNFAEGGIARRLALAGRATAGIPGVFDPTFLGCSAGDPTVAPESDFGGHLPPGAPRVSRWAVDGGVVVNLPLGEALDRVFHQEASGLVRRVLLYVYPTPGPAKADAPDRLDDPPSVVASLLTVLQAPRAESVSVHVDAIRRHNDVVKRQQLMRRSLGPVLRALLSGGVRGREELFAEYRRQRAEASIESVIERHRLVRGSVDPRDGEIRASLRHYRSSLLPAHMDALASNDRSWAWGIAPIEEAASIVLDLVNRALSLAAYRSGASSDRSREGTGVLTSLGAAKQRIHGALREAREIRQLDARYWNSVLAKASADPGRPLIDVDFYAHWPYPPGEDGLMAHADRGQVFDRLREAHTQVAVALADSLPLMVDIVREARAHPNRRETGPADESAWPTRAERARDLGEELRTLVDGIGPFDAAHLQRRLLEIHLISTLLVGRSVTREQTCELMQLSWNAPNALDPGRTSESKLVGTEMARLGAFLKPSWRANDWFWGRMDAAARLAQVLVDGRRLHELGVTRAEAEAALGIGRCGELSFLDDDLPLRQPPKLDRIVVAVTRKLQLRIAREELPVIAAAIDDSLRLGTPLSSDDAAFRDAVRRACGQSPNGSLTDAADDDVCQLVELLRIGSATFSQQRSSELTLDLAEQAYDVSTLGLAAPSSGLPETARHLARWAHRLRIGGHFELKKWLRDRQGPTVE